jgi:hypothetical protein
MKRGQEWRVCSLNLTGTTELRVVFPCCGNKKGTQWRSLSYHVGIYKADCEWDRRWGDERVCWVKTGPNDNSGIVSTTPGCLVQPHYLPNETVNKKLNEEQISIVGLSWRRKGAKDTPWSTQRVCAQPFGPGSSGECRQLRVILSNKYQTCEE